MGWQSGVCSQVWKVKWADGCGKGFPHHWGLIACGQRKIMDNSGKITDGHCVIRIGKVQTSCLTEPYYICRFVDLCQSWERPLAKVGWTLDMSTRWRRPCQPEHWWCVCVCVGCICASSGRSWRCSTTTRRWRPASALDRMQHSLHLQAWTAHSKCSASSLLEFSAVVWCHCINAETDSEPWRRQVVIT